MVSGSVHSHSSGLLACLVCCPVWIIITQKEAFPVLLYQAVQKVNCVMCPSTVDSTSWSAPPEECMLQTWYKKPGTEVCIGCHALYWQFYQQWTDESWCVAPACCLHIVVLGIVCYSRDIAENYHLRCNCSHPSCSYSPFNPVCTPFNGYIWLFCLFTLAYMTHVSAMLVTDMSCGNVGQYHLNSNVGVCVCVCVLVRALIKYEAIFLQFYRIL